MERKHDNNENVTTLIKQGDLANGGNEIVVKKSIVSTENPKVLIVEPFYGGSHKQLVDLLTKHVSYTLVTLSAKKWPWRARCGALVVSDLIPEISTEETLFCSSVLSLAELLGLRQDLQKLKKVVYFHENQFNFPIRQIKDRDVQFAYNQITTCLAADEIIFNSQFNKESLLGNLNKILKLLPDYRPKQISERIAPKCKVLYFPVDFPKALPSFERASPILTIVWPHRWEFDKDPETFLQTLIQLKDKHFNFKVHILGDTFKDVPDIFNKAKELLQNNIASFGFIEDKSEYFEVLKGSHLAVSTAIHEFFGVSMLEACSFGCFPLVPNRLVYPEIYPKECLFEDGKDLLGKLEKYCRDPGRAVEDRKNLVLDFGRFSAENLLPSYMDALKM